MSDDWQYFLFGLFWYAFLTLLPGWGFALLLHFLLSLPMQRRDRGLFFLDIIETALDRGQALERTILSAAETRDRMMGVGFYLLAAQIENGARFGEALDRTPGFLHPQVNAILRTGEKMGDIKKVLPACREVLRVPPDPVRTTMHYMVTILLLFAVVASFMIWLVATFVVPRFRDVAAGAGVKVWAVSDFVFNNTSWLITFEVAVFLSLITLAIIYIGGPGFVRHLKVRGFPILDWVAWHLPWKRKKLQRSFSAMLAVLLDGGVPEAEAVRLAGDCTVNEISRKRAARILAALQQGMKLDEAVRVFDDSGEFHWRLANATHARGGFLNALQGWHAALEAKAFQQEETAAHTTMSGIVILNGVVVALFATALFGVLVAIVNGELSL
ncbi:MAG TPA: type II secretion system F family protein [Verrucomicrobiae bacterium]|jgi:type II secretory pathway component PulF